MTKIAVKADDLTVDYNDPASMSYASAVFSEAAANDGSISTSIVATISDDTMRLSILTLSIAGAQVNSFTTQGVQLDPVNPITVGLPVLATGTLLESHLVNVGSLANTAGTINAVEIIVSQA